jgi:hypothetical protein
MIFIKESIIANKINMKQAICDKYYSAKYNGIKNIKFSIALNFNKINF